MTKTKQQIAQQISADIESITTHRGIKKEKVSQILRDILGLIVPDLYNNDSVEVFNIENLSVYRKLLFEPDGNNLSSLDTSIPIGHKMIALSSFADAELQLQYKSTSPIKTNEIRLMLSKPAPGGAGGMNYIHSNFINQMHDYKIIARLDFEDSTSETIETDYVDFSDLTPPTIPFLKELTGDQDITITFLPGTEARDTEGNTVWPQLGQSPAWPTYTIRYKVGGLATVVNTFIKFYIGAFEGVINPFTNVSALENNNPHLQNIFVNIEYIENP